MIVVEDIVMVFSNLHKMLVVYHLSYHIYNKIILNYIINYKEHQEQKPLIIHGGNFVKLIEMNLLQLKKIVLNKVTMILSLQMFQVQELISEI